MNRIKEFFREVDANVATGVTALPVIGHQVAEIVSNGNPDFSVAGLSVAVCSAVAGVLAGRKTWELSSELKRTESHSKNRLPRLREWTFTFSLDSKNENVLGLPHEFERFFLEKAKIVAKVASETGKSEVSEYVLTELLGSYWYVANRHMVHLCSPVFERGQFVGTHHYVTQTFDDSLNDLKRK